MIVYKDNIICEFDFKLLTTINPDMVMKMIRNKMVARSKDDDDSLSENLISDWIRENCSGLIYFEDESTAYRDNYIYYFEKEEEAVAFKLRWG